jgi:uncharacterized membrane protein
MANKFDTNPLDPDFPKKAEAAAETSRLPRETDKRFDRGSITEDETRRFSDAEFNTYAYGDPQAAAMYQAPVPHMNRADDHRVAKVGLPEKWLIGLPYIPFHVGLVAGLILLFVIPKEETKVRFHAAQGLAAHVGILLISSILSGIGNFSSIADVGNFAFYAVTTVMLVIFAIRAWQGKPVHIESVEDLTNWLEEKIKPRA